MSDVLGTIHSQPISVDDRKTLLAKSKILGIYNKAIIIFDKRTEELWAVLEDKRVQLSRSDLAKLGISTKDCK